jgi:hypothetical protein
VKFLSLLLAPSLALTISIGFFGPAPVFAQSESEVKSDEVQPAAGGDESLNSMWNDSDAQKSKSEETRVETKTESKSNSKAKKEKKTSTRKNSRNDEPSGSSGGGASSADLSSSSPIIDSSRESASTPIIIPAGAETTVTDVGGLCTVSSFQASDLVRNSAWPGIGPFTGSDNQYSDPQDNKLNLHIDGDHVTACELLLNGPSTSKQGFLNLQMVCDFMLEALGSKGSKIAEFNAFLERNKEKVTGSPEGLKSAAGAYSIALSSPGRSADNAAVLIQITSKSGAISPASSLAKHIKTGSEEPGEENAITPAVDTPPVQTTQKGTVVAAATVPVKKPVTPKTAVKPTTTQTSNQNSNQAATTGQPTASEKVEPVEQGADPLRDELAQAIRTWQTIKKAALKDRDTKSLNKILSGKLLQRQILSINALIESKHYYELTPKGVVVEKYTEIAASPKRYSVYAKVKELTKIMKVGSTAPEKETDDTYNVNYTVEKSGDGWTISDSLLLVKKK